MVKVMWEWIGQRWAVLLIIGVFLAAGLIHDHRRVPVVTDFTARAAGEMGPLPYSEVMSPLPALHADPWMPQATPAPPPAPRIAPQPRQRPVRGVAAPPPVSVSGHPQAIAAAKLADRGWQGHWNALNALWSRESGWNPNAVNKRTGACGIPQRHPCNGLNRLSAAAQIDWGLQYIAGRYGTPSGAWAAFKSKGWY